MRHFAPPLLILLLLAGGCSQEAPIVTYSIPTTVPTALAREDTRMLAAIIPQPGQAWFFKIMGRQSAVDSVASSFEDFVKKVRFEDGVPALNELPEGWRKGAERAMRFASIDIDTPSEQLDISISQLARREDWTKLVKMNVNRWRGQVGLDTSDEEWASATEFSAEGATDDEASSIWVDITGRPKETGGPSMMGSAPFAGMAGQSSAGPFAANSDSPPTDPHAGLPMDAQQAVATAKARAAAEKDPLAKNNPPANDANPKADSKLEYDRPEGWRDGRMSMMRMAAFNVGPEDAQAELTVITAGGDLRGNVARWMGQISPTPPSDEEVDAALAEAQKLTVGGRDAQRFILLPATTTKDVEAPEDAPAGEESEAKANAIDATLVPLESGMTLFIKMTGPVQTVEKQSDSIQAFLKSLKF